MGTEQSSSRTGPGNDNKAEISNRNLVTDLVMGLRFYSRLPISGFEHEAPDLTRMAPALPFTSFFIGIGPALVLLLTAAIGMPPLFAAGLAVGTYALITGAMAEDAIADSADGLFGGQTIERRLEILKDSRHGTYGVTALALYILLRVSALAALVAISPLAAAGIWLATGLLSRSGALWLTLRLAPARRDGVASTAGRVTLIPFLIGAGFALLASFIFAAPFTGIIGLVAALVLQALVALGWTRLCRHLIGGQTGDLIGGLQALLEIAALSAFIVCAGALI